MEQDDEKGVYLTNEEAYDIVSYLKSMQKNIGSILSIIDSKTGRESSRDASVQRISVSFNDQTEIVKVSRKLSYVGFIRIIDSLFKDLPNNPILSYRIPSSRSNRYALLTEEVFYASLPKRIRIEEEVDYSDCQSTVSSISPIRKKDFRGIFKTKVKSFISPLDKFIRESEHIGIGTKKKRGSSSKKTRNQVSQDRLAKDKIHWTNRSSGKKVKKTRELSQYPFL